MKDRATWIINNLKGKTILDIGFYGEDGMLFKKIQKQNNKSLVVGVDINKKIINSKLESIVIGDINNLPFKPESFDSVAAFEIIEHLTEPNRALAEIYRVLKKRGQLFLTTPNALELWRLVRYIFRGKNTLGDHTHKFLYDPSSLIATLEHNGFKNINLETLKLRIFPFGRKSIIIDSPFKFLSRMGCTLAVRATK